MEQRRELLLVAWALLLGLFLWSIHPVLRPVVLFLSLVYLLTPLFGTDLYRRLVITLSTLMLLWLISVAGSVLAPFALALVLAYIADPLVDYGERRGVSRTWGALFTLLIAILLIVLGFILLVPIVAAQAAQFLEDLPRMIGEFQLWYRAQVMWLARSPLPFIRDIPFERALTVNSADVQVFLNNQFAAIEPSWRAAVGLGRGVQTALTILGYVVLTPVLTFYLLRDLPSLRAAVSQALPRDRREETLNFLRRYDRLLGEFLRGQLLVAAFVGLATGIGFWIVGFPNPILLGVIAGVFNIVPYLGLIVSLVPALVMALVDPPLWLALLKVAGVFFAVQTLEGSVLSPKIIGDRVGLHPVWVMLAILAFGSFFGIIGLLLAIPLAVLIKLLLANSLVTYKRSVYFRTRDGVVDDAGAIGDAPSGLSGDEA